MQALATKERRVSLDLLGPPVPLALQGPPRSFQSAVTAQFPPEAPDPGDQLDHQVLRALKDHQEMMESQAIPVRTEKLVLRDLQASLAPLVTPDLKETRETVEMVNLAQGDLQDLQDPQEQDSDLLLWTWRAQGSPIWTLFGDCQAHKVLLVPPVLLVPRQQPQD